MENSIDEIWRTYRKTKCPEIKEKLILKYAPMVKFAAGRLSIHIGQHVDYDDLISYGIFGLIDAIDKFDPEKGVKFETYATLRIKGTIIDNIRKMDWVPRTLRQKNKKYEQICRELESELGREATIPELAVKLKLSIDDTRELIKNSTVQSLVSLDTYLDQKYESAFGFGAPEDTPEGYYNKHEIQTMLTDAIDNLTEREKTVISLYYFEGLTLKEISGIIGVSESRISQIHSKAISRMQNKLGSFDSGLFFGT